ncbi:MAG: hypothetical protein CSA32_03660 [Desulfobulbus propionicus]|nr:MAG: hypothetical protein CSA32_03660 [Desulfobulbus propionicus]
MLAGIGFSSAENNVTEFIWEEVTNHRVCTSTLFSASDAQLATVNVPCLFDPIFPCNRFQVAQIRVNAIGSYSPSMPPIVLDYSFGNNNA